MKSAASLNNETFASGIVYTCDLYGILVRKNSPISVYKVGQKSLKVIQFIIYKNDSIGNRTVICFKLIDNASTKVW